MTAPRVFFSYSHDDQDHKDWVLTLATRLVKNGVDVVLDQWDLNLGGDLPLFMESGVRGADRIAVICTKQYVDKADGGRGGVGYEKMILTARAMKDMTEERIIPVVRAGDGQGILPTFLSSKRYIDFRDDELYEVRYAELLRDIHGVKVSPRPPLGSNPFLQASVAVDPVISFSSERYVSPASSGSVRFDFSNNNGRYVVGSGDMAFETAWSSSGSDSIHAYSDAPSIKTIALARGMDEVGAISDASVFDTSSRVRTAKEGEILVWQNVAGYFLATRVERVDARSHGSDVDEIEFSYVVAPSKGRSFSDAAVDRKSQYRDVGLEPLIKQYGSFIESGRILHIGGEQVTWRNQPHVFLRLIPVNSLSLDSSVQRQRLASQSGLPLEALGTSTRHVETYSERLSDGQMIAALLKVDGSVKATSVTKLFSNGALWGVDQVPLRENENLNGRRIIPSGAIRQILENGLSHYIRFYARILGGQAPLRMVTGLEYVDGLTLALGDGYESAKCVEPRIVYAANLDSLDVNPAEVFRPLYERLWDACGEEFGT